MIFDHFISPITGNPIIVPVNNPWQFDAWEFAVMIANAFPYWCEPDLSKRTQFPFNVCGAGGYNNGIEFTRSAF
jgi:hypothetical protein